MTEAAAASEIPWDLAEAIASWQRVMSTATGDRVVIFRHAAGEIMRTASFFPDNPAAKQAAVDELHELAQHAELDVESAQLIMSDAANGHANGKTAAVATSPEAPIDDPDFPAPTLPGLAFVDPTRWQDQPVPARRWLVPNRIPLGVPSLLGGDGAAGKTTIALQLAVATVRSTDWLGSMIDAPGPVIFMSAEEDEEEVHRRLAAINEHFNIGFADLAGLHVLCMPGEDAILGAADKAGHVVTTPLFNAVQQRAKTIRPTLIIIEAAADVFGGNENDRGQVRQFVGILRRLAIGTGAAVLLISHPSLSGMASGTGTSGSTGWSNSVRSRLYFAGTKGKEEDEAASDLRELHVKKSNYGPPGEIVRVKWQRGVFVPVSALGSLERVAAEATVDNVFLRCLDIKLAQGIKVGPAPAANYAPKVFEKMTEANGLRAKAFVLAMERQLSAGRIAVEETGPASKRRAVLVHVVNGHG